MIKRKIYKLISSCLVMLMVVGSLQLSVSAAIFSVSASDNGNGTITVNVSGQCAGGFTISAGGASASIAKSTLDSNATTVLKTGYGTFTVTATAISVSDASYNLVDGSVSTTVVVSDPTPPPELPTPPSGGGNSGSNSGGDSSNGGTTTPPPVEGNPKSSNNLLGGITLSTGALSPEFSGDQTEYTVTMPANATSINILASTQDEKATVSGIGDHALNAGLNSIVLSVTAENGEIRNYTINVHVDEKPLIFTDYGENKLGVVRNLDEIGIPDSFEETTVKINDQEVKAWKSNLLNKTIVFMSNETGDKSFYVYEDGKGITSKITPMGLLGRNVYILDISKEMQVMEGFTYGEVTIDDKKMMGWTFNNPEFKNYALIYVMKDNGEMVFYQYESTEKSLQVYSGAVPYTQTELDEINKNNTNPILLYGLIGGVVVSLGIAGYAIYQLIRTKKYYSTNREGINQVDEYDDFEG